MHATAWNQCLKIDDRSITAGEMEIRDLARGLAGALFVSLPLLFTMEMWEISKTIPDTVLLVFLAVSFLINSCFVRFASFRRASWIQSTWWDAAVAMGIGAVASTITLLVAGIIGWQTHWYLAAKTIALETIPTGMGAAVAVNQLGGGDSAKPKNMGMSPDLAVLAGTALGAFLFSFNIAPTIETKVVVLKQTWWQTGLTVLLSLGVSYLMVSVAQFEIRDLNRRRIVDSEWLEALLSYIIAFLLSMLLLWVFGYGTPLDPIDVWLPQTIVLAYATTLGGAAGRLVL